MWFLDWFSRSRGVSRLLTLEDYRQASGWLQAQHARGKTDRAVLRYCQTMHRVVRTTIDQYVAEAETLNQQLHGLLDSEASSAAYGRKVKAVTPLRAMKNLAVDLVHELDEARPGSAAHRQFWNQVLTDRGAYATFLKRVVEQFGNFERIVVTIPGTDERLLESDVQRQLLTLYRMNLRTIRMVGLARELRHGWREDKPPVTFLRDERDPAQLIREMVHEYLVRADPARVTVARRRAPGAKPHQIYRFWRSAENLRQLSGATYVGERRRPRPTRPYLDFAGLDDTRKLPVDYDRVAWAIKEVFNNALDATSKMSGSGWEMQCKPLRDPALEGAALAISTSMAPNKAPGDAKRPRVRITITDRGVGIPSRHVDHVVRWAYSPRRASFAEKGAELAASRALTIGGKGIGLSFAADVMSEHGGELTLVSRESHGTTVHLDLAVDPRQQHHARDGDIGV